MFSTSMFDLRPVANPKAVVRGDRYRFTVLTGRMIRMEWDAEGKFEDHATKMVLCRDFPVPEYQVRETEDSLEIITEFLHLYYNKQRFSQTGLSVRVKGTRHKCAKWFYQMPMLTWNGENSNLHGTARTLDNVDGACELEDGLLNRHGFTTLDDTDTMILNEEGWYEPARRSEGQVDMYFLGYPMAHKECVRDFYHLSGATPMLPRYALGNWWSRYYKYTEETYKELIAKFRQRNIPLSVSVLDMDWHVTKIDPKYGDGWSAHTWNRDFFPDPPGMLRWLHDHGLKVTLNLHPHNGIQAFEDCYPETARAMGIDPATEDHVEFDAADPKFMRVYLDKVLHPLEDEGVDFWWTDWQQLGGYGKEGYDPLWMLNHYLYTDNARRGQYSLTLSRYAGPGSHRYPLGFSGDTGMSWESLDFQPYFTNCASNIGYGWWSHDIGGHWNGVWSDELQVRWLQYGVFSPIMRLHSASNTFLLKEPWVFPAHIENTMADFLRLRHRLIPYLYTMNYRSHAEGIPLCCPLYYDYPEKMTYKREYLNEYTFGSQLLVCPITSPMDPGAQTGRVHAWIPEGTWYDIFNGRRYVGEKRLALYRSLDQYPVLAKAGAILPLTDGELGNGTDLPEKLELQVYCGADGSFTLYEDDEQLENTRSAYTQFHFAWGPNARFCLDAVRGDGTILPEKRNYRIRFIGLNQPSGVSVTRNGQPVSVDPAYDPEIHCFQILLEDIGPEDTVQILLETDGALAENDFRREIEERLPRYQIENATKQTILDALKTAESRMALAGAVASACDNDYVVGEMLEIITSAY